MPARVELFGVEIDPLRMDQAVAQIFAWVSDPAQRCRFVVTPNVDHVVMLQYHPGLQAAYRDAGMVLVDGAPVLWSSQLLQQPLPERVAGSDLVPALFNAARDDHPLRRCNNCLSGRRKVAGANLAARYRSGMALPSRQRAATAGRPLRQRCLDLSAAGGP